MEDIVFTVEEIREQLEQFGYHNVPIEKLKEFKRDLEQLVIHERDSSSSVVSDSSPTSGAAPCWRSQEPSGLHYRPPLEGVNAETSNAVNPTTFAHQQYGKENTLSRGLCGLPYYASDASRPGAMSHVETAPYCQPSVAEPYRSKTTGPVYISRPVIGRDISDSLLQRASVSSCSSHQGASDVGEPLHQTVTDTSLNTTTSSDRRMIKRKVLRRRDGQAQVFDEMTESEVGDTDMSSLQDRLSNLPISVVINKRRPQSAPPRHTGGEQRRPLSAREPCYRLPADFDGPKALIRPMTSEPHWQRIKKCDPVNRGELYRKSWQQHRAPGEKNHNGLRWNVREHMLRHDAIVEKQPSKSYVRNSYVIPSDKKRKTLRWQIRQKLAEGAVPSAAQH